MPTKLNLSPDELLTTTRAVRRRLDLSRPVEREVIEECVEIAQQAPNASNRQDWHFVLVTDPKTRAGLGELYRKGAKAYFSAVGSSNSNTVDKTSLIRRSALFLVEHIHEVPVHVIPCIEGRTDGKPANVQAVRWGSIFPATWSFILAARARGLGTTITSFHLQYEREAAELLGIPYEKVMQACLLPLAYTSKVEFRPAKRNPLTSVVHWDLW